MGLSGLTDLDMGSKILGKQGAVGMAELLRNLPQMRHLTLDSIHVESEGIGLICEGLGQCTLLQTLDLSGNDVDEDSARRLARALIACAGLLSLSLRDCGLAAQRLELVSEGITDLKLLSTLDLQQNPVLDDAGLCASEKLGCLLAGSAALRNLRLSYTNNSPSPLVRSPPPAVSYSIDNPLYSTQRPAAGFSLPEYSDDEEEEEEEDLTLSSAAIRLQFDGLARGLARCSHVQSLEMGHSGLRDAGCVRLAEALSLGCPGLERLDLTANLIQMAPQWREKLERSLGQCCALTALDLKQNPLGPCGASALVVLVMAGLTRLRRLDVSGAALGPEGVGRVAVAVGSSVRLEELRCVENEAGCEGATRIAEAMRRQRMLAVRG